MKTRKSGSRHALLFYRRTMNRVWQSMLVLGLLMVAAGVWTLIRPINIMGIHSDIWLFICGVGALVLSVLAFFSRYFAYLQPKTDHLQVVTPLLRFKVGYNRVLGVRPVQVHQIFTPEKNSWAQNAYLEPFMGKTALVMELKGLPLNSLILRLFLPDAMLYPQTPGLVLLTPDWMKLSTELDSFIGTFHTIQKRERQAAWQ